MSIPFSQVRGESIKLKVTPSLNTKLVAGAGIAIAWPSPNVAEVSVDFSNLERDDITSLDGLYLGTWDSDEQIFKLVLAESLKGAKGDTGSQGPAGTGNVNGPSSAIDRNIVLFDGATGKLIKDSGLSVDNLGVVSAKTYASGSIASTTGTISAAATTLVLASALDFKNGQGIRVNHAGAAHGVVAPTSASATAVGTTGSTTYTYTVVPFNATGGYTAAIATFAVTNGNATLSQTNYNSLTWSGGSGAVGYAIYGRIGGALALIGYTNGTAFFDYGASSYYQVSLVDWLTSTPPASAANSWLVTTVSSGGGTTLLTLGSAAGATATAQGVYHDDTIGLQAALTAAKAAGKALDLSGGGFRISSVITITAPVEIKGSFGGNSASSAILLTSPTQDGISITGGNYANLHDFSMWGNGAATMPQMAGSAILISNSGGHTLRNINTSAMWHSFNISGGPYYISGNLISGYGNVINVPTFGDSGIINNSLSPIYIPGSNAGGGIGIAISGNPGGTKIIGNKINSAIAGYVAAVTFNVTFTDGDILICDNSFEGWSTYAVLIDRTGAFTFGNIQISSNQFAGGQLSTTARAIYSPSTTNWLSSIVVNGNIIYSGGSAVDIQGGSYINISGNVFQALVGVSLGSGTSGCNFGINNFTTTPTQINNANACIFAAVTGTKPTY